MTNQNYKRGKMIESQEEEGIYSDDSKPIPPPIDILREGEVPKRKESSKVKHRQIKPIKKLNTK